MITKKIRRGTSLSHLPGSFPRLLLGFSCLQQKLGEESGNGDLAVERVVCACVCVRLNCVLGAMDYYYWLHTCVAVPGRNQTCSYSIVYFDHIIAQ